MAVLQSVDTRLVRGIVGLVSTLPQHMDTEAPLKIEGPEARAILSGIARVAGRPFVHTTKVIERSHGQVLACTFFIGFDPRLAGGAEPALSVTYKGERGMGHEIQRNLYRIGEHFLVETYWDREPLSDSPLTVDVAEYTYERFDRMAKAMMLDSVELPESFPRYRKLWREAIIEKMDLAEDAGPE